MTLEVDRKRYVFRIKEIWFSDQPHDVAGCHRVIFRDCRNKTNVPGFRLTEQTTLVVDLTEDIDAIFGRMDKDACRYSIRRAVREGITVSVNQHQREFHLMNRSFRERKGLLAHWEEDESVTRYGTVFAAELDHEVIAGNLYMEDKDHIRWLLGASKRLEVDKRKAALIGFANRLLIWEAMQYAKAKGIREFDLGGYYTGGVPAPEMERVNAFKKGFGGQLATHYIYEKDYSLVLRAMRATVDCARRASDRIAKRH
jgi:hypothetical protein